MMNEIIKWAIGRGVSFSVSGNYLQIDVSMINDDNEMNAFIREVLDMVSVSDSIKVIEYPDSDVMKHYCDGKSMELLMSLKREKREVKNWNYELGRYSIREEIEKVYLEVFIDG